MLLVHQSGSVHVGDVIRYTITYTPGQDRILPSPSHLHVKIKNTSPIPLRAAYLHGPYSLYVAAYSSTFNPYHKVEDVARNGVPMFEPFLKAGAHWSCKLIIPEDIRESGDSAASPTRGSLDSSTGGVKERRSVTWILEITSQVIFSQSASVHFELLVGRDERSLDLGFAAVAAQGHGAPGQIADHRRNRKSPRQRETRAIPKGVYSRAIKLVVEDTTDLWDKPALPRSESSPRPTEDGAKRHIHNSAQETKPRKKQRVHLVVLTHGLHSNLSADMLYLKESIDATAARARENARARRQARKRPSEGDKDKSKSSGCSNEEHQEPAATAATTGGQEDIESDSDEEQVIVRGFSGNAIKTERGIQYLGKRLAKHVLSLTYPSQPYIATKKKVTTSISQALGSNTAERKSSSEHLPSAHHKSSIHRDERSHQDHSAYRFTSISFVGHSLGGLVQLYAIAYIQKHAPEFFQIINPVNFICMASPLLGLSNENPMYVKFALDFGLVGRTGQDLGLTWRAPTLAKSGWSAMGGVFGSAAKERKEPDPGAKPLLRILPTGPAHHVLHLFRNRTVYSNVVNDGIVPLRTSCLLFLDWKGLAKIDKYRRQQGLLGTMVEWGWAEMTGANAERDDSVSPSFQESFDSPPRSPYPRESADTVPQPSETATEDDNNASRALDPSAAKCLQPRSQGSNRGSSEESRGTTSNSSSMFDGILNFFRPSGTSEQASPKMVKAIQRGQTLTKEQEEELAAREEQGSPVRPSMTRGTTDNPTMRPDKRPLASRGDSVEEKSGLSAPPKTSIFESASDLLHPPVPSTQFIIDPASRSRTIFHDRVYHPADIPPPPRRSPTRRTFSTDSIRILKTSRSQDSNLNGSTTSSMTGSASDDQLGGMKVEEKIARAYHHDLSWRKVLVRLEPDAHNNMVVRRMFANAYGWPVIKHLCDTHFSDSYSARTRDEQESNADRATVGSDSTKAGTGKNGNGRGHTGDRLAGSGGGEDGDGVATSDAPPRRDEGEEVHGQTAREDPGLEAAVSERRETRDELGSLDRSKADVEAIEAKHRREGGSIGGAWDERLFEGADEDGSVVVVRADRHEGDEAGESGAGHDRDEKVVALDGGSPSILAPEDLSAGHFRTEPDPMESN